MTLTLQETEKQRKVPNVEKLYGIEMFGGMAAVIKFHYKQIRKPCQTIRSVDI